MKTIYNAMPGIRPRREAKGLTISQASQQLGISRQAWYQWEALAAMPGSPLLPMLARLLGCSIEDLYGIPKEEQQV